MDLVATILPPVGGIGVDHLMHAGDRFLTVPVSLVMWAITAAILAVAVRRTNRELDERTVPLMGVMAAFIFAAQMFNFQVVGGTSGHLLGGVLAGVLLGPWVGTLVMASVVAVQALVFSDGGLVVMGANIFNMGVVGTLGGFALYRALTGLLGGERRSRIPAAAIAAYVSFLAGAVTMSIQLIASGTSPAAIVLPTMLGVHAIIGIGEALITAATLGFIASTRPDLLALRTARPDAPIEAAVVTAPRRGGSRALWLGGIGIAVLFVVILAPLASADPDGLERVAIDLGFIDRSGNVLPGLLAGYEIPGISDPRVSTILSGLLGIGLVLAAILVVGRLLVRAPRAGTTRTAADATGSAHPHGHVHPARPTAGGGGGGMDRYVEGTSIFHRADARLKFVLAIAAILCISLVPIGSGLAFLIAWLALVSASATAGLGPFRLSRTAVIAIPFTLAALPLVFTIQEAVIGAVDLGPVHLTVSAEGLRRFLTIAVGSWLSVQVALLLAFTTPFHDLIDALRELRLPRILVSIVSFMYRYLAVLTDEGARMLRARDARSVATASGAPGGSLRWRASVTGHMVGSLFLRAYERSERIYAAMQARGFEGEFRHLGARAIDRGEYAWFAMALAALALYLVAALSWLPTL